MEFFFLIFAPFFAIVLLSVLHELGHYWAARLLRVPVTVFSIGTGKTLWEYINRQGTIWRICRIPICGYVRIIKPEAAEEGATDSFRDHVNFTPLKYFLIVAGGPLMNLLVALSIFFTIGLMGETRLPARIGEVVANSITARAGLAPGDIIVKVDNSPVTDWNSVFKLINSVSSGTLTLATKRAQHQLILPRRDEIANAWGYDELGMLPDVSHYNLTLASAPRFLAAQAAGISRGDVLNAVNGITVSSWQEAGHLLRERAGGTVDLAFRRGTRELVLPVTLNPGKRVFAITGLLPEINTVVYHNNQITSFPGIWMTLKKILVTLIDIPLLLFNHIRIVFFGTSADFDHAYSAVGLERINEILAQPVWRLGWFLFALMALVSLIENIIPLKKSINDGYIMLQCLRMIFRARADDGV